jgi:hypothetical protein
MAKSKTETTVKNNTPENNINAVFGKKNYMILAVGLVVMTIGYLLMIGGKTTDPNVFNPDELYSSTRITVAPILILSGILICGFSIFYKDK